MPQPMKPAPSAERGWESAKARALDALRFAAGLAAPVPYSPGAMAVAGIRAVLPGGGSYRDEYDRYNAAATEGDSVTDKFPAPGESPLAFTMRQAASERARREVMQGASMAAPIAVHASPTKYVGQPRDEFRGTGEGGAAYGKGHYATVPSNAQGVDFRYRKNNLPESGTLTALTPEQNKALPPWVVNDIESRGPKAVAELRADFADRIRNETEIRNRPDNTQPWLSDERIAKLQTVVDALDALHVGGDFGVNRQTGSFHVWDVPDTLLDYDRTLASSRDAFGNLRKAGAATVMQDGRVVALPDGPMGAGKVVGDSVEVTGKDMVRALGEPKLAESGVLGHTYSGEAGSARTSGIEGDVPNFVIYRGEDITPLGTFGSAEEWLASDLYRQLKPRIDAEEALRRSGQATPEAYARIRAMFASPAAQAMEAAR